MPCVGRRVRGIVQVMSGPRASALGPVQGRGRAAASSSDGPWPSPREAENLTRLSRSARCAAAAPACSPRRRDRLRTAPRLPPADRGWAGATSEPSGASPAAGSSFPSSFPSSRDRSGGTSSSGSSENGAPPARSASWSMSWRARFPLVDAPPAPGGHLHAPVEARPAERQVMSHGVSLYLHLSPGALLVIHPRPGGDLAPHNDRCRPCAVTRGRSPRACASI